MLKNKVWMVVKKKDVPKNADIIDSMWAMKKKANGQYHARLAARGFKQTHGKSFEYHDISSPVVHNIMVRIVLTILLMSGWAESEYLVDSVANHQKKRLASCINNSSLPAGK